MSVAGEEGKGTGEERGAGINFSFPKDLQNKLERSSPKKPFSI